MHRQSGGGRPGWFLGAITTTVVYEGARRIAGKLGRWFKSRVVFCFSLGGSTQLCVALLATDRPVTGTCRFPLPDPTPRFAWEIKSTIV